MINEVKYDLVVIGSGLGGLLCALIFAKEGKSVCVLEKNNQIGGSLQTFVRDKQIFDSGIHYVGSLDEGQTLNMYFKYFGLMDKLKIHKLDENGFEHIYFKNSNKIFKYGMGYQNFKKNLLEYFPNESSAINQFIIDLKKICEYFPTYNAEEGEENYIQLVDILNLNFCEYLDKITSNNELKNVLGATNMLHAGLAETTPFYVHALILNSYIESAYRFIDGGSQIARILSKQIKELGGKIFTYSEVTHFEINDKVEYVSCNNGKKYYANTFISNIHPSILMDKISTPLIRPAYKNRLKNIQNTTSIFIVNLILKKESLLYRNYNYYYFKDDNVWQAVKNIKSNWPASVAVFYPIKKNQYKYVNSLTIMTYMDFEVVKEWDNTYNTVYNPQSRGESYENFKKLHAEKLIDFTTDIIPELKDSIENYYVSTPLTYRDFIATKNGSIYGYIKNNNDPLNLFISPKTKIANLLMTGQNLHLHGVYGVTVTAIKTCGEIFGNEYLMKKIKSA